MRQDAPVRGVLDKLKGLSGRMTISQVVVFLKRQGVTVTKTTIQNYVRVGALPPPDRRHYTKNHVLTVLMIGHLKNIYSLEEIRRILEPVSRAVFYDKTLDMAGVYEAFCKSYDEKCAEYRDKTGAGGGFLNPLNAAAESLACRNVLTSGG